MRRRVRLRIAQVLTASTGGIGRHVAELTGRLLDRGDLVEVWCPPETADQHLGELVERGLRVHHRVDGSLLGADVVHAHGYKATAGVLPIARLRRIPLVSTWHNLPPGPGRGRQALDHRVGAVSQRLAARADLVLGASADLVEIARALGATARLGPVAAPRLDRPRVDRADVRRSLGSAPGAFVVLTVGRLAPQKNLGMLVDVATQLSGRLGLEFWVAGAGPEHERLTRTVAERGLAVRLLGHRTDVAELIGAADVALLTSHWEARALFAQEAMAAGLPLVTTRVGGMAELVDDAAVLVAPDDGPAAARAIEQLAAHPDRRSRLAELGRSRAREWPTADDATAVVLDAYAEVLGRNGSVR